MSSKQFIEEFETTIQDARNMGLSRLVEHLEMMRRSMVDNGGKEEVITETAMEIGRLLIAKVEGVGGDIFDACGSVAIVAVMVADRAQRNGLLPKVTLHAMQKQLEDIMQRLDNDQQPILETIQ